MGPNLFSIISLVSLIVSLNAFADQEKRFKKIHGAIFDTFVPFEHEELDTSIEHLLDHTKASSYKNIRFLPNVGYAFVLLDNLHLLHNKIFLKAYYHLMMSDPAEASSITKKTLRPIKRLIKSFSAKKVKLSIRDLTVPERLLLFSELIQSEINVLRFLAFYLRLLYSQLIYQGALGEKISGVIDKGHRTAPIIPGLPRFSTHLHYDAHKRRLEGALDMIIVGSGASGAIAAHEFQRKGLKVLVVESGSLIIPGAIDTTSDLRFMEGGTPRLTEDGSIALLNGSTVGGGTTINLDMSFPPNLPFIRHRFHQWHKKGLIPHDIWTDQEIDKAYAWVKHIFEPRTIDWDEVNQNNKILIDGAIALGIPFKRYELNHYKPNDSPHTVYNKKSSFEKLLLPAMIARNYPASLLTNCQVTRVLIKQGTAYGVECIYEPKDSGEGIVHDLYGFAIKPKTRIKIYAHTVVLAAGNLGTSAVLLNSKIKNENIGRGYVTHPFVSLMGRFKHEIQAEKGEPSTIFIDHFMQTDRHQNRPGYLIEAGLGRIGLWALLIPGLPNQVKENFSTISHVGGFSVMITDTPNNNNRIEIGKDGQLKVHYQLGDSDRKHLIDGIKTSVKLLFAAGATDVSFNSFEYPLFQSGGGTSNTLTPDMDLDKVLSQLHIIKNQTSLLGAHMMSGNKMGITPTTSVVNDHYQVWGINQLYVIDSSIFPASVGANPMQTIYTCAKIFTDRFLANAKKTLETL